MNGVVSKFVELWAWYQGFVPLRQDRGAKEFLKGPTAKWNRETEAFVAADCIFWPSKRASHDKKLFRHELCHVRQGQRQGYLLFSIQYLIENYRVGYACNRFERAAVKAESRK